MSVDVVLLAGGGSSRMGSDKASLPVAGRRLIDHVLDDLTRQAAVGRVVVVAPETLALPAGLLHTMENPPGGGPVAGLVAGLAALGSGPADRVVVLTCDAPRAGRLVPQLTGPELSDAEAVIATSGGRPQYLLACYRVGALLRALKLIRPDGTAHGASMHRLVAGLDVTLVPVEDWLALDLDDPDDVARWLADGV